MPELPDLTVYLEALEGRILGATLEQVRIRTPFLLRSVDPPLEEAHGKSVTGCRRVGKRLVIALEGSRFLVLHLMIAGRLRWKAPGAKLPGRSGWPRSILDRHLGPDRGGHEAAGIAAFRFGGSRPPGLRSRRGRSAGGRLRVVPARPHRENHTVKRALTDPAW